MEKEQLFKKYSIDESHKEWESQDNHHSIELYRLMHEGKLPKENDLSVKYITEFLDMVNNDTVYSRQIMFGRSDFGNLYLTAKRMVYRFSEQLLNE